MTTSITLFLGLTLSLAAVVLLYVANLRLVAREHAAPFPRFAIVPLFTPVHAWRLGARALPALLAISVVLYALFWASAWIGAAS